jgi:hypothetical protein
MGLEQQAKLFRMRAFDAESTSRDALIKIRTIPGPANRSGRREEPFTLLSDVSRVCRQQTKNLLVSYSPKKLGFFQTRENGT